MWEAKKRPVSANVLDVRTAATLRARSETPRKSKPPWKAYTECVATEFVPQEERHQGGQAQAENSAAAAEFFRLRETEGAEERGRDGEHAKQKREHHNRRWEEGVRVRCEPTAGR